MISAAQARGDAKAALDSLMALIDVHALRNDDGAVATTVSRALDLADDARDIGALHDRRGRATLGTDVASSVADLRIALEVWRSEGDDHASVATAVALSEQLVRYGDVESATATYETARRLVVRS